MKHRCNPTPNRRSQKDPDYRWLGYSVDVTVDEGTGCFTLRVRAATAPEYGNGATADEDNGVFSLQVAAVHPATHAKPGPSTVPGA